MTLSVAVTANQITHKAHLAPGKLELQYESFQAFPSCQLILVDLVFSQSYGIDSERTTDGTEYYF